MPYITRPNSWVSQDAAATTQFTYGLQLNPAPLTVSIKDRDPILGSLEFVITNPTATAIALNSVTFTIQVGTDGSDLTTSTDNVGASVTDTTDWQIQTPGKVTSGPAAFVLAPQTGNSVNVAAGASIIVEIYNFPTVENPGNSIVSIKEVAGAIGFTSFLVTTFPSGFYFNSLSATVENGSQLLPCAQVVNGAPVTLVWNSSVVKLASFKIFYSNATLGQQTASPSDTGIWTSPPLTSDTVFTVMVTVSLSGGEPLSAALSTAVSVQNPNLVANSLTAVNITTTKSLTAATITATDSLTAGNITALGVISGFGTVPIGAVLDWWAPVGATITPPANFAICDGHQISDPASPFNGHNTPNLVKKFIYGVSNTGEIGQSGGSSIASVSINSQFSGTTSPINGSAPVGANTSAGTIVRNFPSTSYRFSMASDNVGWNDGQHVHNFTGSATGSTSITTIPPFVCLLKIVRIK